MISANKGNNSLLGKTAFLSGAGRNIGRAIALELAAHQCNLVLNALKNQQDCDETAQLARAAGAPKVLVLIGNIGDRKRILEITHEALFEFSRIDIAINNASVRPKTPFLKMSDDDWYNILDANLNSAFHLCRAFLPGMVEKNWGRIVNITGRNAIEGYSELVPVSVSKHGLWGMTKSLAKEFGSHGITSNAISPGVVRRIDQVGPEIERRTAMRVAEIPSGRIGEPEDIAALTGFLCSNQAKFINGQMIASNGGAAT